MVAKLTSRVRLKRFLFFFPFQLLMLHIKRNHLLLLCWLVLFGYITQSFSVKYGLHNLFLYPEYFGKVSMLSYGIVGFSIGGFITAFNLYSYIMHGFRFPFIATLSRPFFKFCVNNFIIPALFMLTFIWNAIDFQVNSELVAWPVAIMNVLGAVIGLFVFFLLSFAYFALTNQDMEKLEKEQARPKKPKHDIGGTLFQKKPNWQKKQQSRKRWHVETYLAHPFKIMLARSIEHYDKQLIQRILRQNHVNGSIFEIILIVSFLLLGALSDLAFFAIPAAASVVLLFTMLLMTISAVFSWFKGWTLSLLIAVFLLINFMSSRSNILQIESHAMGLDYEVEKAEFNKENLEALAYNDSYYKEDVRTEVNSLMHWRRRNMKFWPGAKPKLVILNVSGGGSRSMLWTLRSIQHLDSVLDGSLIPRTRLITGSSGGMITAAYVRELARMEMNGAEVDLQDKIHAERMSSEVLNTVGFSLATNDVMIRYKKVFDGNKSYTKDRGFEFEKRIVEITDGVLDRRVNSAKHRVAIGELPMMVLSPTIVNDGRRLLISSQPISYLCNNGPGNTVESTPIVESIEFDRFFSEQDAEDLKLTSALRMNATFPFILPVMSLPSEPTIQVMDAGIRDNYGMLTTMQYLYTFRNWISTNTSGVVIIQVRDKQKDLTIENRENTMIRRLLAPVGSVYSNFVKVQDHEHDRLVQLASEQLRVPLEVVPFQLRHDGEEAITLSWRLTALEKQRVMEGIYSEENQEAADRLRTLLLNEKMLAQEVDE